jgi:hypothetical protein
LETLLFPNEYFLKLYLILGLVSRALRIKFENTLCRIISRENNGGGVILIDESVIPLCLCWFKIEK